MSEGKPNIVVVVMDTARQEPFTRSGPSITPAIDEISSSGTSYSQAFSAAPWTLPSHASLFTGMFPSKHGTHAGHKRLEQEHDLLAEVLSTAGYQTVAVSNNTWISEEFGFGRGFETFHKTWQYVQSDVDLGKVARTEEGMDKLKTLARELLYGNPITNVTNAIYGQFFRRQYDDGARRTNDWIEDWLADRADARPFFLFVNYLEPHLEYRPPEEVAEQFLPAGVSYDEAMAVPQDAWGYIAGTVEMTDRDFEILRALYRAEIAYLDRRIGELREMLEAHGEWENTVFVVTGDHGENIGDHGLMDHQYCLYDTLLHVPLVLHGGSFTGGGTVEDLVSLTDLGPTLLDDVGIDAPEFGEQTQGRSFHPDAEIGPRNRIVAEYLAPQPSMDALETRVGGLPEHVREYDRSLRAVRTDRYKYIRGSDGSLELYDIQCDPGETEDLADARGDVIADLDATLEEWLDSFEHADLSGDVEMRKETRARLDDLGYLQ